MTPDDETAMLIVGVLCLSAMLLFKFLIHSTF
jgi:hypothetical protein